MPPQGLGLGPGQTWVTWQGQRPHPGLGEGAICRKQPCCQQGGAPPFLLWLTLLHMYGVGGAAEWGGTQEPQEDRP